MQKRKAKSNVWALGVFFGVVLGVVVAGIVIYQLTDRVSVENASKIADPNGPRIDESAIQLDGLLNELEDVGPVWQEPDHVEISPDVQEMIVGGAVETKAEDANTNAAANESTTDPLDDLVAAITAPVESGASSQTAPKLAAPSNNLYAIQAGAFSSHDEAKRAINNLGLALFDPRIEKVTKARGKVVYRVMLGPYATESDAQKVVNELNSKGIPSFITL
jgi:septal ring-binding cell division protein DamX